MGEKHTTHTIAMYANLPKFKNQANAKPLHSTFLANEQLQVFIGIATNSIISSQWYLDSGANQHMLPLQLLFHDYKALEPPQTIPLGDNSS